MERELKKQMSNKENIMDKKHLQIAIAKSIVDNDNCEVTEETVVRAYRSLHPQSRAGGIMINEGGSVKRVKRCVVCGLTTTWCGRWRRPQKSVKAEQDHVAEELAEIKEIVTIISALG
jgi:hypothetical protein